MASDKKDKGPPGPKGSLPAGKGLGNGLHYAEWQRPDGGRFLRKMAKPGQADHDKVAAGLIKKGFKLLQ